MKTKISAESEEFLLVNVDDNLYNYKTGSSAEGGQPVPALLVGSKYQISLLSLFQLRNKTI
jgi:hypothetical protein